MRRGNESSSLNVIGTDNMGRAKYKVGDVIQIKPGIFIGGYGKKSDDNTFGVITDVYEYKYFNPDYCIDLYLSGSDGDDDQCYECFNERCIVGRVDRFCEEEDICAEEICFLL